MPVELGDMHVLRFKIIHEDKTVRIYCCK